MNERQHEILRGWWPLLCRFVSREFLSLLFGTSCGAALATTWRLLSRDASFKRLLLRTFSPVASDFDGVHPYADTLVVIGTCAALIVMLKVLPLGVRAFNSWTKGVTSGVFLFPLLISFALCVASSWSLESRMIAGVALAGLTLLGGFVFQLKAMLATEEITSSDALRLPTDVRATLGAAIGEEDDPIETWEQDALDRSALVETLSIKVLVSKAPVVALFGKFGEGKTSILNLLKLHLRGKAVVISFSTWLPGSPETLASNLLGDVSTECRKLYVVPGLRKSLRRLVDALSGSVSWLKGLSELLSPYSQRDDLDDLRQSLSRLPQRVVVLLDELDRMQQSEIITLLKIIRGVSSLPNISFICALEREKVEKTICKEFGDESHAFFEKFFPTSVPIPKVDEQMFQRSGVERVTKAFKRYAWFESAPQEEEQFHKKLLEEWEVNIAPYCDNLRRVSLLANDISVAAAPLVNEVDPIDLVLIEVLHRFQPEVYEIIWRNRSALAYDESFMKASRFISDAERQADRARLPKLMDDAVPDPAKRERAERIIKRLFPGYGVTEMSRVDRSGHNRQKAHDEKRIADPDYFPTYFRYELPQAVFSSRAMAALLAVLSNASSPTERERLFREALLSIPKGSLKRDDFLQKLSKLATSMSPAVAQGVAYASMKCADDYTYDMFHGLGESGHVLRFVLNAAQQLRLPDRAPFLSRCIIEATDDSMALRIFTDFGSAAKSGVDLGVSKTELIPSFLERMRARYGRSVDASTCDLTTSDARAFGEWSDLGSKEQLIQADFWRRYIADSRARLAYVFGTFLMPSWYSYSSDPEPIIEKMMPVVDLRRMFAELPRDASLSEADVKSLQRLKRLVDGRYRDGIPVGMDETDEDTSDQPTQSEV